MNKKYKYLDDINFPSDIKNLSQLELKVLADEVRQEMIDVVSDFLLKKGIKKSRERIKSKSEH